MYKCEFVMFRRACSSVFVQEEVLTRSERTMGLAEGD